VPDHQAPLRRAEALPAGDVLDDVLEWAR